jgi:hypothetical protein
MLLTEEDLLYEIGLYSKEGIATELLEGISSFVSKIYRKLLNSIHQLYELVRKIIKTALNRFKTGRFKTYAFESSYQYLLTLSLKISLVLQKILDNKKDLDIGAEIYILEKALLGIKIYNGGINIVNKVFNRKVEVTSGQIQNITDTLDRSSKALSRYQSQLVSYTNSSHHTKTKEEFDLLIKNTTKMGNLVNNYVRTANKVSLFIVNSAEPV